MTELSKNTQVPQCDKTAVSGNVFLQIGMHVKIIDDKIGFPMDSGKVLKITNNSRPYNGKRSFELNNREGDIFLIEDFEYCVEYPDLQLR
jgi:hypothetical protein